MPLSTKQVVIAGAAVGVGAIVIKNWKYLWPWTLKEWQMLVQEKVEDPEEEILDAHHHFWDFLGEADRPGAVVDFAKSRQKMGCRLLKMMVPPIPQIQGFWRMHFGPARSIDSFCRRWLAADMKEGFGGHKVIGSVYVQCGWEEDASTTETAHQLASKNQEGLPSAMVAKIMLADGAEKAEEAMDKELKGAGGDKSFLVGFRSMQNSPPELSDVFNGGDIRPLDSEESIAAAKAVGARGFAIDLCCFHNNLPSVTSLAEKAPETTFILDHIGIPIGVGSCAPFGKVLPEWRTYMTALAKCPNVYVKLSGMGMSVFGSNFDWGAKPPTSDDLVAGWSDLVTFVISTFGVDRCMFASNFPPDGVSCSYAVLWNAYKKIAKRYTPEERRKLFRDTAVAAYKLKL